MGNVDTYMRVCLYIIRTYQSATYVYISALIMFMFELMDLGNGERPQTRSISENKLNTCES